MWIECTETNADGRPLTQRITVNGEVVEFTQNGKANVPRDIGEALVSNSDMHEPVSTETDDSDSTEDNE